MVGADRPSCGGDGRGEPHGNRSASRDPRTVQGAGRFRASDAFRRIRPQARSASATRPIFTDVALLKSRSKEKGKAPNASPFDGRFGRVGGGPVGLLPAGRPFARSDLDRLGGVAGGLDARTASEGREAVLAGKRSAQGAGVSRPIDGLCSGCGVRWEARQEWKEARLPRRRSEVAPVGREGGGMAGATSCPRSERRGRCFRPLRRGVRRLRGGASALPAAARSQVR